MQLLIVLMSCGEGSAPRAPPSLSRVGSRGDRTGSGAEGEGYGGGGASLLTQAQGGDQLEVSASAEWPSDPAIRFK